jgi:hypothetical protein
MRLFPSQKGPVSRSRTDFQAGVMTQSILSPQARTSNGGEGVKAICYSPYLPDIAPLDLFICQRVKSELAGLSLLQGNFKTSYDGVIRTISKVDFAEAFRWWMDRCKKYVCPLHGNYTKKNSLLKF